MRKNHLASVCTKRKLFLILLITYAFFLSARYLVPVNAQFSDTETVSCNITAGTWETETRLKISSICPSWGLAGACRWPALIYGKDFKGGAEAFLAKGDQALRAVKTWVISPSLVYAVFDLRCAPAGVYDVCLRFPDGRTAVLSRGFTVEVRANCGLYALMDEGDGKRDTGWQKLPGAGGQGFLGIATSKAIAVDAAKAYAVAPGKLIEGSVAKDGRGGFTVFFDLRGAHETTFDVVLLSSQGYSLLLEGFITPADIKATVAPPVVSEMQVIPQEKPANESSTDGAVLQPDGEAPDGTKPETQTDKPSEEIPLTETEPLLSQRCPARASRDIGS